MFCPMAKLKPDPVGLAEIQGYLAANDDFAFELRCMRELKKRHIEISHGGTYSDPVTGKNRQFDFRLKLQASPQLRFAIPLECKNLKANFPLLVSRVPRLEKESFHHLLAPRLRDHIHVEGPKDTVISMNPSETITMSSPTSIYQVGEMVGKSTVQIGRAQSGDLHGDDSEVHEKWSQALASAHDMVVEAHHSCHTYSGPRFAVMTVPVVVVPDGMLWTADYKADGSAAGPPAPADEVTYFVDHDASQPAQYVSYMITHLHFVTLKGLLSLVDRLSQNEHVWRRIRPEAL
jgi:hypothetical protein